MDVLRDRLLAPVGPVDRLDVTERTGSTNTDLAAAVRAHPGGWDGVAVLVTEHQVDGRGRSGRGWQTPVGAALTFSVAVRPAAPAATWGWLPLLVGLGAVTALRSVAGVPATLKWPNDLMVDVPGAEDLEGWGTQRKLGGILVELVSGPTGPVAIVGVGINVAQTPDELPVATAQSLQGVGAAAVDREELLVALVETFAGLRRRWEATGGDVVAAGLADEVVAACTTIGRSVRVELPGGEHVTGLATGLAVDGALRVRDAAGSERSVRAGDVRHVRAAP
ncbi:biotin--[acetyl-CoA-carboxylase] ligase [Cellulomonas sp. ATA003]|uniref:biotin--[acetyl-CoA-carboxylase] ligase n=1 Tax=Cellulomonas sp. ATA003 TaxID=3073064 RepID=UPI0028730B18|nr:biotin--[acetyl-CoA-carboxylase] ligase [Cellulomonas sp. ATA003]WNB84977.1 biotin--[acetyl-CoA-carboxylase] ligase [Cellulomonas sp. ATA003]